MGFAPRSVFFCVAAEEHSCWQALFMPHNCLMLCLLTRGTICFNIIIIIIIIAFFTCGMAYHSGRLALGTRMLPWEDSYPARSGLLSPSYPFVVHFISLFRLLRCISFPCMGDIGSPRLAPKWPVSNIWSFLERAGLGLLDAKVWVIGGQTSPVPSNSPQQPPNVSSVTQDSVDTDKEGREGRGLHASPPITKSAVFFQLREWSHRQKSGINVSTSKTRQTIILEFVWLRRESFHSDRIIELECLQLEWNVLKWNSLVHQIHCEPAPRPRRQTAPSPITPPWNIFF